MKLYRSKFNMCTHACSGAKNSRENLDRLIDLVAFGNSNSDSHRKAVRHGTVLLHSIMSDVMLNVVIMKQSILPSFFFVTVVEAMAHGMRWEG